MMRKYMGIQPFQAKARGNTNSIRDPVHPGKHRSNWDLVIPDLFDENMSWDKL